MPSANKTPNIGLNQWQGNEYPKREDFVTDNLIIDTALKENADALLEHQQNNINHIAYAVATGTANAYAVAIVPAPAAYVEGLAIAVKINADSTGASTINVNNLGAKPIKKANGGDVTNLKAGGIYTLRYDGNFIVQGEGGEYGTAEAEHVLENYTIGTEDGIVSGTMINRGAVTITPSASDQAIAAGYHNGSGKVAKVTFDASKVLTGTTIAGTAGTMTNNGVKTITPSTADQALEGYYASGSKVVGVNILPTTSAGNAVIIEANAEKEITSYPYYTPVKMKEITVQFSGTIRVSFSLRNKNGGTPVYGQIYKNGSIIGTLRNTYSAEFETFSEDFTINIGDKIQLYCYTPTNSYAVVRDFKISGTSNPFWSIDIDS